MIKYLSEKLQPEFGSGFSARQMNLYRQFYRTFPIVHALHAQLSWTQYKLLLNVDNEEKRDFMLLKQKRTTGRRGNWKGRFIVIFY
ncbi:DUF1016 N-terminal domain-containing protein [Pedobacter sp. PF22-3]|uniref:DUF1016 N-terminal domain-containing protein n=1 Tax=Pedobacter sp. PF22-3 TaxID=2994467 RepID=UPI002244FD7D|nr:DUF1016 N-terminal domain-containing protein [Pedobacter sp. PF22-3]MCX2492806.1 DUF1016 N-terminal domain-containing protein [Pedobacter sp. PF22-3]